MSHRVSSAAILPGEQQSGGRIESIADACRDFAFAGLVYSLKGRGVTSMAGCARKQVKVQGCKDG